MTRAFLLSFFLSASLYPASPIVGTWELVAATPVEPADVDPHGFMNHKTRYTADGRIYMVPANELLNESAYARYGFDGGVRTISVPGHESVSNALSIRGDLMTLTFQTGRKLTYRRMSGQRPWDRLLEPRSLEVLKTRAAITAPAYDNRDYSKLPLAQRIQGIWEVAAYASVKYPVPPHGLPNDKYVITASRISLVPPDRSAISADTSSAYILAGAGALVVEGEIWRVSFDVWQRMILHRQQDELTLRLVQKAVSPIPRIPITVALLPEDTD